MTPSDAIQRLVSDDDVRAELRSAAYEAVRFVRKVAKKRAEVEDAGSEHTEPSKAIYLRLQASNMLIQAWSRVAAPEAKAQIEESPEEREAKLKELMATPEVQKWLEAEGMVRK